MSCRHQHCRSFLGLCSHLRCHSFCSHSRFTKRRYCFHYCRSISCSLERHTILSLLSGASWLTTLRCSGGPPFFVITHPYSNPSMKYSMWPLLKRDGLSTQYITLVLLWNYVLGYNPFRIPDQRKPLQYVTLVSVHSSQKLTPARVSEMLQSSSTLSLSLFTLRSYILLHRRGCQTSTRC